MVNPSCSITVLLHLLPALLWLQVWFWRWPAQDSMSLWSCKLPKVDELECIPCCLWGLLVPRKKWFTFWFCRRKIVAFLKGEKKKNHFWKYRFLLKYLKRKRKKKQGGGKKKKTSTRSKPAKSEANFPDTWRLNWINRMVQHFCFWAH